MKCRTCNKNLSDPWIFYRNIARCYACLEEERVALELASSKVKSEQINRSQAAQGTRPS